MRIHLQRANLATVAVGLLFVGVGIYGYFYMGRFLDHAQQTRAVVIEVVKESATPKGRTHPVVRFTTSAGAEVVVHSDEHHNVKPADTVQLLYDPRNPQSIEITTLERARKRRLLFTGVLVAFGLFVCVLGVRQKLS